MRKLIEKKIILATHNAGKVHEIEDLLMPYRLFTISAIDLDLPIPKENGSSFEENAFIKAFSAAKATNFPALSDDSGLQVAALNGAPGIYTADWAFHNGVRDFASAMEKLEKKLQKTKQKNRSAFFISLLCLAWPDGHAEYFRGEVKGTIVWPPRGELGFGYDPIFQPNGYFCTFGEMTAYEKHSWRRGDRKALSHRARAFRLFAEAMLEN